LEWKVETAGVLGMLALEEKLTENPQRRRDLVMKSK